MSPVAIVTDSCASIPQKLLQRLNIHWVPYYIHRGSEVLLDMVTAKPKEFYRWLADAEVLPKTATPGPGDYLKMYEGLIKEGIKEIVSIHMTSKGSGAFQAAKTAAQIIREKYPRVQLEVIDTLNVSLCHGWMVIEAAREALQGASFQTVVQTVQEIIPRAHMLQTAHTLKYLHMGGRIGKAKHLVGKLLNIKPIISMKDGVIVALGQARTIRRAYQKIVELIEEAVGSEGEIKIAYVHAAAQQEAEKLKKMVEERVAVVESLIAELSPALGVHSGPGTVGVCFYQLGEGVLP